MTSGFGATPGTVYLVGAGPGDAGLVTQRALELVRAADVLLVDRLGPAGLADEAPDGAERIDVGKTAGNHAMPQDEINERLVAEAKAGRIVVRIKGGDPYLFGRGGEEAAFCRAAGVPFEVVPAVTSAFAACADAGIPVTHRDVARHVTVVTASAGRDGQGDPDYGWLAGSDGTVVLLMGLRRVGHIARELITNGKPHDTPVAVISRGTTAQQRTVVGTLDSIDQDVLAAKLASPAIVVIGEVVRLRDELDWFERRPLFGRRIGVTRARAQASELSARLEALGAEVVEAPAIRSEALDAAPLDALLDGLTSTDTLLFTSARGVELFFARLAATKQDARALAGTRIGVVGTATARACQSYGIVPDVVPPIGARTAAGLLETLRALGNFANTRIALVRAESGDETLPEGLRADGAQVELVPVYRTVVEQPDAATIAALAACDVVTLASASTAGRTAQLLEGHDALPPAITMGPTTTAAAREHGFRLLAEAPEPSVAALVETIVTTLAKED